MFLLFAQLTDKVILINFNSLYFIVNFIFLSFTKLVFLCLTRLSFVKLIFYLSYASFKTNFKKILVAKSLIDQLLKKCN